jgi:hypothetical protein
MRPLSITFKDKKLQGEATAYSLQTQSLTETSRRTNSEGLTPGYSRGARKSSLRQLGNQQGSGLGKGEWTWTRIELRITVTPTTETGKVAAPHPVAPRRQ